MSIAKKHNNDNYKQCFPLEIPSYDVITTVWLPELVPRLSVVKAKLAFKSENVKFAVKHETEVNQESVHCATF